MEGSADRHIRGSDPVVRRLAPLQFLGEEGRLKHYTAIERSGDGSCLAPQNQIETVNAISLTRSIYSD